MQNKNISSANFQLSTHVCNILEIIKKLIGTIDLLEQTKYTDRGRFLGNNLTDTYLTIINSSWQISRIFSLTK